MSPLFRSIKAVPFCERSFSFFFLVWGLFLIIDHNFGLGVQSILHNRLERYLPSWIWGTGLLVLGFGRFFAFYSKSCKSRVILSLVSFIFLSIVAAISIYSRLWATTAPFSVFIAYISFWCYRALLRDIHLELDRKVTGK